MTLLVNITGLPTLAALGWFTWAAARADYQHFGWHPLWRVTTEHTHQDTP